LQKRATAINNISKTHAFFIPQSSAKEQRGCKPANGVFVHKSALKINGIGLFRPANRKLLYLFAGFLSSEKGWKGLKMRFGKRFSVFSGRRECRGRSAEMRWKAALGGYNPHHTD
jgi:hypothetical protein